MIRVVCNIVKVIKKVRLRFKGSAFKWFWLARIMSGNSQQDKIIRGEEVGSILKYMVVLEVFKSKGWLNNIRLESANNIEYTVKVGNRIFELSKKAEGIRKAVGIIIFNILVSLRFLYGLFHVFGKSRLGGQDQCWLHRRIVLKVK